MERDSELKIVLFRAVTSPREPEPQHERRQPAERHSPETDPVGKFSVLPCLFDICGLRFVAALTVVVAVPARLVGGAHARVLVPMIDHSDGSDSARHDERRHHDHRQAFHRPTTPPPRHLRMTPTSSQTAAARSKRTERQVRFPRLTWAFAPGELPAGHPAFRPTEGLHRALWTAARRLRQKGRSGRSRAHRSASPPDRARDSQPGQVDWRAQLIRQRPSPPPRLRVRVREDATPAVVLAGVQSAPIEQYGSESVWTSRGFDSRRLHLDAE